MALFSVISALTGSPIMAYPLFATGMAAMVLAEVSEVRRRGSFHKRVVVITFFALPALGLLGGVNLSFVLILPSAFAAVLLVKSVVKGKGSAYQHDNREGVDDDPLTNLCISLPSAVTLIAVVALT